MLSGLIQSRNTREEKDLQNQPHTIKKIQPKDRLAEWIQKQDPYICCLQETHFTLQDTYRLKVRGWKNIFHANGKQKKARVAILISDKINLKIKITRDKEGHYTMIKGSVQEEDNNCKYLCTQHRSTSITKKNTNRHKRRN